MVPRLSIEAISERCASADVLVIGEVHGIRENGTMIHLLLENLIATHDRVTLACEWPLTECENAQLSDYVLHQTPFLRLPTFFAAPDGRFTREHVGLLSWVSAHNATHDTLLHVVGFERPETGLNDRERDMSRALAHLRTTTQGPLLVSTGSLHARNSSFTLDGQPWKPMMAFLKEQVTAFGVYLEYAQGTYWYEGQVHDVTALTSVAAGPGIFFDAAHAVPSAHASRPATLTDIERYSTLMAPVHTPAY